MIAKTNFVTHGLTNLGVQLFSYSVTNTLRSDSTRLGVSDHAIVS